MVYCFEEQVCINIYMFGAKALIRTLRCKRLSIGTVTERYTEMLDNISQTIQNFWIILEKLIQK